MTNKDTQGGNTSFTLTRSESIIERLALMQKLAVMIYVKPATEQGDGVMTTLITKILPEKNLLAIDVSADAALNLALENCGELVFTATVDGVAARFNAPKLTRATLGGKPAFAIPIPASLFWRERRRSHRLPVPPATPPMTCSLLLPGLNLDKFPVLDMSLTGFSLLDENQLVVGTITVGHSFQGCQFSKPAGLKDPFNAKLCRTEEVGRNGTLRSFKLGFRFEKMTPAFEKGLRDLLSVLAQYRKQ
jgi:c-di-GMP-binding flagellar brake protein YcgR